MRFIFIIFVMVIFNTNLFSQNSGCYVFRYYINNSPGKEKNFCQDGMARCTLQIHNNNTSNNCTDYKYKWYKKANECQNMDEITGADENKYIFYLDMTGTTNYKVIVTSQDVNGDMVEDASECFVITVHPAPSGNLDVPSGDICTNMCSDNFEIKNLVPNNSSISWTFPKNNNSYCNSKSSISNPTNYKFEDSGNNEVKCKLSYIPATGLTCSTDLKKDVNVIGTPNGTSIEGPNSVCIDDEKKYSIKDCTTCGTSTGYSWTVDPSTAADIMGSTSNEPKVKFISGIQCTLKVTISNGSCTQMLNKVITINPLPSGTIKVNTTGGVCQNQTRTYSIDQLMNCTDCKYSWSIDPQDAGTPMNGSNSTFEVNWTKMGNMLLDVH
ncbi:MAG: hypothetical protein IPQ10_14465 [Saprospiraceae bacterium]|nr:hypothetical protein [Saprospiraceae bacterium]